MGKRKQGREWDNEKHEEALQRHREKEYCRQKEKYMREISEREQSTETPINMNEEEHNDQL